MIKRILINIAQVLAALAVLALLIFLAFKGSVLLLFLFSLAFIGAAVMLAFYVRRAVLRGEVPGRFGSITFRHVSPISFWFQIGVYALLAGFLFFNGLALLGLAPHWFIALLRSMHSHH
jgi:hypothetical protein